MRNKIIVLIACLFAALAPVAKAAYDQYIFAKGLDQSCGHAVITWYNVLPGGPYTVTFTYEDSGESHNLVSDPALPEGHMAHFYADVPEGAIVTQVKALVSEPWFSAWENADGQFNLSCSTTAVELARFEATEVAADHVDLEWETITETNNLGFNLYRVNYYFLGGKWEKLNDTLIPGQMPGLSTGAVYNWRDQTVSSRTYYGYWLEDVDFDGTVTLHGPVNVFVTRMVPWYPSWPVIR